MQGDSDETNRHERRWGELFLEARQLRLLIQQGDIRYHVLTVYFQVCGRTKQNNGPQFAHIIQHKIFSMRESLMGVGHSCHVYLHRGSHKQGSPLRLLDFSALKGRWKPSSALRGWRGSNSLHLRWSREWRHVRSQKCTRRNLNTKL